MAHRLPVAASCRRVRLGVPVLLLAALLAVAPLLSARPARAAAVFTVTRVGDGADLNPGNGRCDASPLLGRQCTLRAAIEEANASPGADAIAFAVPGGGVTVIRPSSFLPAITEAVTIDGYTQSGASPNTAATGTNAVLRIVLDGTNIAAIGSGLRVTAGSGTIIRGLVLNRFSLHGIETNGGASGTVVAGCFIGTNAAGTVDLGNGVNGVNSSVPDTTVGGDALGDRNLIAGNGWDGIGFGLGADGSQARNNLIGTDATGAAPLANDNAGVDTSAADVTIGVTAAGSNVIAHNGEDGVRVTSSGDQTSILQNSIFANGGLGIDLNNDGVTANDALDADGGPNGRQNFPIVTAATSTGVEGTFNSTPNADFDLRLFSNPGVSNEGKFFEEGPLTVTTDGNGDAEFAFAPNPPLATDRSVTVTATDAAGNTSEFSTAFPVED